MRDREGAVGVVFFLLRWMYNKGGKETKKAKEIGMLLEPAGRIVKLAGGYTLAYQRGEKEGRTEGRRKWKRN